MLKFSVLRSMKQMQDYGFQWTYWYQDDHSVLFYQPMSRCNEMTNLKSATDKWKIIATINFFKQIPLPLMQKFACLIYNVHLYGSDEIPYCLMLFYAVFLLGDDIHRNWIWDAQDQVVYTMKALLDVGFLKCCIKYQHIHIYRISFTCIISLSTQINFIYNGLTKLFT